MKCAIYALLSAAARGMKKVMTRTRTLGLLAVTICGWALGCGDAEMAAPGPAAELCPSCQMQAGGATSDFGGDHAPCDGRVLEREKVTLERARELGFDAEARLAPVERELRAPVRWSSDHRETEAVVRIARTGMATVVRYALDPEPAQGTTRCHEGDHVVPELEVEVELADGSLAGSFITNAGPNEFGESQPRPAFGGQLLTLLGDAAAMAGDLDFQIDPEETSKLTITLSALLDHPEVSDQLELVIVLDYADDGGWVGIDGRTARPATGCHVGFVPEAEAGEGAPCVEHDRVPCCQL